MKPDENRLEQLLSYREQIYLYYEQEAGNRNVWTILDGEIENLIHRLRKEKIEKLRESL